MALALKSLLTKVAVVSRARRLAVLAGCMAFLVLAGSGFVVGISISQRFAGTPLMELNSVLYARQSLNSSMFRNKPHPTDRQFAVFIAVHYPEVITNETTWSSPFVSSMIGKAARTFAERSVAEHPNPSAEEREEAERAVKPYAAAPQTMGITEKPWFPFVLALVCLGVFVGTPALIAALLFRGGLVLFAAGVAYVRRDGERASRLRVFWRGLVAWSILPISGLAAMVLEVAAGVPLAIAGGSAVLIILALVSVCLPERGLPERLSGTWPVPR